MFELKSILQDSVVWALNCASTAMVSFNRILSARNPAISFYVISGLSSVCWTL